MRFLSVYKAKEKNAPPTPGEVERRGKLIERFTQAGILIATEGCLPSSLGARVRISNDKVTVTDGPFTESKELVAGFALLECKSKAHAIEVTREFLAVVGEGECELRQIF